MHTTAHTPINCLGIFFTPQNEFVLEKESHQLSVTLLIIKKNLTAYFCGEFSLFMKDSLCCANAQSQISDKNKGTETFICLVSNNLKCNACRGC